MANLLLQRLDSVPAELDFRSVIAVGTGSVLSLYIGNSSNDPVLLTGGSDFASILLGENDYDEEDPPFTIDETKMLITLTEKP